MSEKLPFSIVKGGLAPANKWCTEKLRERKYSIGDIVFCQIRKPRNPKFNSLVHAGFARLLIDNIDTFSGMKEHDVLKRLQIEARISCKEIGLNIPGVGPCIQFIPESLSFESMGQEKFQDVFKQFCRYISEQYWPDMTDEQIEHMARHMEDE